jgi:hypothetical protein
MKKNLTLIFILTGIFIFGYAQKFQLTDLENNPYVDGQTISATITEDDLEPLNQFVTDLSVHNLTGTELEVITLRTNIALPEGIKALVCWKVCDESGEQLEMSNIIEGKEAPFSLHLLPKISGTFRTGFCKFKIDFTAEDESMTLFFEINVQPLGVKENSSTNLSLSAYPNPAPANSIINISYTLADRSDNRLVIRNIMGAEVISMPLNLYDNMISVNIAALKPGVYFYAIENKNQISIAKKLIIK